VTNTSPAAEKVTLFRRLFAGRADVFPLRWDNAKTRRSGYAPACANEWVKGVCGKPQVKCGECPNQAFIAVSDVVIANHLRGEDRSRRSGAEYVAGVYPMRSDETTWFLAIDFDDEAWSEDTRAFLETCQEKNVPAALERSRSGNGGHVWIFFAAPVSARSARQLGALLLTATRERRPEIGFASYDRMFPNQDTMPAGGFGNLIALPLQRRARERGHSLFVDADLVPHEDQWAFLSTQLCLAPEVLSALAGDAELHGRVLPVLKAPNEDDEEEPWLLPPSRKREPVPMSGPLPQKVTLILANDVYVERSVLPPALVARIVSLAAFQNPEFYRAQRMRLSTHDEPRIISCAELHAKHVSLPRGCLDDVVSLLTSLGIQAETVDHRVTGEAINCEFQGTLRDGQREAFAKLASYDSGVLAAGTAFGKTVVAAAIVAQRKCSTLVLVHRRELAEQWAERLRTFLSIDHADIGMIGGGRRKRTGRVDIALIQSLVRKREVSDLVDGYGQLIVDECHHLSAVSFELVARRSRARYVLGLSATVARKDGKHPIIFMQCGPVRYQTNEKEQATERGFAHRVRLRATNFSVPTDSDCAKLSIPALYGAIARDEERNALIFDDVLKALDAGRSPIVLTERRDHLDLLRERFSRFTPNCITLRGGLSAKERRAEEAVLQRSAGNERLVLATGRYLGEGFDDPRLDTLFLTMPIAWRGTLAQYVGRLHRQHEGKREVIVYDYADVGVPVLARMAAKRRAGYRAMGYSMEEA
jgi:superfamily II DNA or RNA helicase